MTTSRCQNYCKMTGVCRPRRRLHPYLARARNHAEAIDKAFRFRLAFLWRLNEVKRVQAPKQPLLLGWRQQLHVADVDEDAAVDAGVGKKVSTSDGVGCLSSELLELCEATFR
eukprot:jgi/Tetstr1/421531/TSEL_012478.t1